LVVQGLVLACRGGRRAAGRGLFRWFAHQRLTPRTTPLRPRW